MARAKQTIKIVRSTVRKKAPTPSKKTPPKRCPSCGKSISHWREGCGLLTEHIRIRKQLKEVSLVTTFEGLLAECTLSDTDKELLRMHYLQEKDFRFIGDALGFTEATVKARHRKALKKIGSLIG